MPALTARTIVWLLLAIAVPAAAVEGDASAAADRQRLEDAWWTGPMLASSAATLPQGHWLIEPYLYDITAPHVDGFGSLTYINYGVSDRLTVGLIPTFGYRRVSNGPGSSHVGVGDVTVQAQWRLTQFDPDSGMPTMSVNVQESLPTGKFDRLGDHPGDGFGAGAYSTTVGWYAQTCFWMANGRILRVRLDLADSFSRGVAIEDVSVYGTARGFRGRAKPGDVQSADLAFEYSLTQNWVLALDLVYRHGANTHVNGYSAIEAAPRASSGDIRFDSGASISFAAAPAIEYNFNANLGLLLGLRVIPRTDRGVRTATPAIALNMVF